jgi:hypothetical protein
MDKLSRNGNIPGPNRLYIMPICAKMVTERIEKRLILKKACHLLLKIEMSFISAANSIHVF